MLYRNEDIKSNMPPRIRVTVTLGQPVVEWLRQQVREGNKPSTGWLIEELVLERMREEEQRKKREGKGE